MNSMSLWFASALVLHAAIAASADIACRQVYFQTVRSCGQSLDLLGPDLRAGVQRACVEGARLTKAYCMSGNDVCPDDCLVAYDRSVAKCEAVFDPAVCTGVMACAEVIVQQRDNCLSHAVGLLETCTNACMQAQ
jgi:hypothetical protein